MPPDFAENFITYLPNIQFKVSDGLIDGCVVCRKEGILSRCAACKVVFYCGRVCIDQTKTIAIDQSLI
jgi:hypothetical protein